MKMYLGMNEGYILIMIGLPQLIYAISLFMLPSFLSLLHKLSSVFSTQKRVFAYEYNRDHGEKKHLMNLYKIFHISLVIFIDKL